MIETPALNPARRRHHAGHGIASGHHQSTTAETGDSKGHARTCASKNCTPELAGSVASPAHDAHVYKCSTAVVAARRHADSGGDMQHKRGNSKRGDCRATADLTVAVVTPAHHAAVGQQPARVEEPRGHRGECYTRW